MDQTILDRTTFLIERADIPPALSPQNPAENILSSTAVTLMERQILSAFLSGLFLGGSNHTLKFSCRQ